VPGLEIRLLGPPRVQASGQALPIRRRRALALAAYLAATRTPHTRESLAALFWPDTGREDALAQLRNHLWVLRRSGFSPWLATEGEMVELRSGEGLWVDVREHRRLLKSAGLVAGRRPPLDARAEPALTEAVELYQGHFLAGFSLAGSYPFEEWQLREEEALKTAQGSALDALIRLREERGDLDEALASARLRADLDPLDERALRMRMTLLARAGRRTEALHLYDRFNKLIARELEVAPSRETVLLRNEILARDPGQSSAPIPSRDPGQPGSPIPSRDPGQPGSPPAASAAVTAQRVLPEPPTPFVGREQELEAIGRFLGEPDVRLLTLTGPGGCGKTRLALEAGRRLSGLFPDGVVFASLVSVEAGHLLPAALAEALALPLGTRDRGPTRADSSASGSCRDLIEFLRGKRMLLILDNLEQVAGDLGPLREILGGTRQCVMLATSRSRLRLAGEQVLEVAGLPWPGQAATRDEVSRCASVRLFLRAIRRARSSFRPSPADLSAAATISRRLRGHPLGLELLATWAHSLSVPEIAGRLAENLELEAAPQADVPPRHRSLRAVFEQSWAMLTRDERAAFRRLCVLTGSFDREAAQEVARSTLVTFAALIEQSFLMRTRDQRFEILAPLRQFGRAKLAQSAREEAAARDRGARHYLGRVIAARAALEGAGQKRALRALARDRHNLRQAWAHAAERGWIAEMAQAARPLFLFYDMSSRAVEGIETVGLALTHLPGRARSAAALRLLAQCRVAQGWFLRYENPARARSLVRQGRRELRVAGTPVERAFAEGLAAILDLTSQRTERELRAGALACERAGDLWCAGFCWEVLACHLRTSHPEEALRALYRSLVLRRRCHDRWSIALGLYVLGLLLEGRGHLRGARRRYEASLALRRRLGVDPDGALDCLEGITRTALHAGALPDAHRHCTEALALAERLGHRAKLGVAHTRLAQIHLLTGAAAEAHAPIEAALAVAEDAQHAVWLDHLHVLSGIMALDQGDPQEARWCLERAMTVERSESAKQAAHPVGEGWPRVGSSAWRDLLAARFALSQENYPACQQSLSSALQDAQRIHHEPLIAQVRAVQAALDGRGESS